MTETSMCGRSSLRGGPCRVIRHSVVIAVALVAGALGTALNTAAAPDGALREAVSRVAEQRGLTGDDLSSAITRTDADLPAGLRTRPAFPEDIQLTQDSPPIRVHVARELLSELSDSDFDGMPDRITAALRVAARALSVCRHLGLGEPADDGDGEVDVYFRNLAGVARGYVVLERLAPPGPGAAGFIVVDGSRAQPRREVLGMVARSVARLVLAARDADAPGWWSEPSAVWLEGQVTGPPRRLAAWLAARWNHPERGLTSTDPMLARGNVSLLRSLVGEDDQSLAERFLAASWKRLHRRGPDTSPLAAIDQAAESTVGMGLTQLQNRAAARRIARGEQPGRWGTQVGGDMRQSVEGLPVAPSGLALIRLEPGDVGQRDSSTRLDLIALEGPWRATLLAESREAGWERVGLSTLLADDTDDRFEVEVPWRDYRSAVVLLSRGAAAEGPGTYRARAESGELDRKFVFSSLSAVQVGTRAVELAWDTTRESGLFGWFVERAASPRGPWRRVGTTPLPSMGLDRTGSHYRIVDEGPGVRSDAYYRVVALTRHGLRITGPTVAVGR